MNLDEAIGVVARRRLSIWRIAHKLDMQGDYGAARDMREEHKALTTLLSVARDVASLRQNLTPALDRATTEPNFYRGGHARYDLEGKDLDKRMAAIFKEPYAPRMSYKFQMRTKAPRQVAPFMFECPGCLQHFGRGKGPFGLARHCCHPSHPQMRRAR